MMYSILYVTQLNIDRAHLQHALSQTDGDVKVILEKRPDLQLADGNEHDLIIVDEASRLNAEDDFYQVIGSIGSHVVDKPAMNG
ncbi:hypothetical protein KFU94_22170 [Chloroflexi bacterium TSY]|nr:hypothetical protein [Chloroflexi bacterium TSY]